jgi:hypothetical protein
MHNSRGELGTVVGRAAVLDDEIHVVDSASLPRARKAICTLHSALKDQLVNDDARDANKNLQAPPPPPWQLINAPMGPLPGCAPDPTHFTY